MSVPLRTFEAEEAFEDELGPLELEKPTNDVFGDPAPDVSTDSLSERTNSLEPATRAT